MKNTSTSTLAALWSALKQAARWVARMFGYKAESLFGRIVWRVFITCSAAFALFLIYLPLSSGYSQLRYKREEKKGNVSTMPPPISTTTTTSTSALTFSFMRATQGTSTTQPSDNVP